MLELEPFVGVGSYLFGSTHAAVKKLNGPPIRTIVDTIMEATREERTGVGLTFLNGGKRGVAGRKLVDVDVHRSMQLSCAGIDLFGDPEAVQRLEAAAPVTQGRNGALLFPELGLVLGGFTRRRIPEGKLAIAFARDRLSFYGLYINA